MRIIYTVRAQRQLKAIADRIAQDRPLSSVGVVKRIDDHFVLMCTSGMADIGIKGPMAGTRRIVEGPYIAVYRYDLRRDAIVVLSVVHGARRR